MHVDAVFLAVLQAGSGLTLCCVVLCFQQPASAMSVLRATTAARHPTGGTRK